MSHQYVVIMAGGRGERFWPMSRLRRPKHLLPIVGESPMLVQTVERLPAIVPYERILVITNVEQLEEVRAVCSMLPAENIVAEPVGRDTAAAVGLAAVLVRHRNPGATFAMLPADHVIHDDAALRKLLGQAFQAAEQSGGLVTLGVRPSEPATGFGYIEKGETAFSVDHSPVHQVARFVEKPDLETAKSYLAAGNYYWNAGMFVWTVPAIFQALKAYTPILEKGLQEIAHGLAGGMALDELLAELYPKLEKISVDYAIMEKASNVFVLEAAFDWDDVGAWPAVARHFPKDANENVIRGNGVVEEGKDNLIFSEADDHLVAVVGLDHLVVVRTNDATLVCSKANAQKLKDLVKRMGNNPDWRKLL